MVAAAVATCTRIGLDGPVRRGGGAPAPRVGVQNETRQCQMNR